MSLRKSNVGHGTHPSPSSMSDLTAPPNAQVLQILAFLLDLRERKVVDLAAPPNINFAQAGSKLSDHAQRLVRSGFPTIDVEGLQLTARMLQDPIEGEGG